MFSPEEIIFAPTGRCNLTCRHCRVTRTPGPLSSDDAIALLGSARPRGVDLLGFSGGEPFLAPDFLTRVTRAAVELDYRFDRLMTNGVWWRSEAELRGVLSDLAEAGFDGTIGVSVDTYHAQESAKLAVFFKAVFESLGRRDCCQIVWVASPEDGPLFKVFDELAVALGGELLTEEGLPVEIADGASSEVEVEYDDPQALSVVFEGLPYSPPAEEIPWGDGEWFVDDLCAGPGNVLYVHPDGRIAVCCGFGNENEDLIVGRLGEHDFDTLLARARRNPFVEVCYTTGLGQEREGLERGGTRFPGKTGDQCAFCDYLCKKGLTRR